LRKILLTELQKIRTLPVMRKKRFSNRRFLTVLTIFPAMLTGCTLLAGGILLVGCASVPESSSRSDSLASDTLSSAAIRGADSAPMVKFSARDADNVNPLYVETSDVNYLWESVVDVIDDFFPRPKEYPIRSYRGKNPDGVDSVIRTEGRIDTEPVIAAGLLEPWKKNSVTLDRRLEASLQTIRRQAAVRVVPEGNGFLIHVAVYNELEDLPQPMNSGITTSLFNDDLTKLSTPAGETAGSDGWIPNGRDFDMEQYIIRQIAWRLKNPPELENPDNAEPLRP